MYIFLNLAFDSTNEKIVTFPFRNLLAYGS